MNIASKSVDGKSSVILIRYKALVLIQIKDGLERWRLFAHARHTHCVSQNQ